jgi:RNA polymerase sigma factor (sigma-70 family)
VYRQLATTDLAAPRAVAATPEPDPAWLKREAELLTQAQHYLLLRQRGQRPEAGLESAWNAFYDRCSERIRKYAFACGATERDLADCAQEVWAELLLRLPTFHLDPERGKFDTWLYHIVRGKTVDQIRGVKRRSAQGDPDTLQTMVDDRPSADRSVEQEELLNFTWGQLRDELSECNYQVLQLRLIEQRTVAEVAAALGLSNEQVWYRYHRARREVEALGSAWSRGELLSRRPSDASHQKKGKRQEPAQGSSSRTVSRSVGPDCLARRGGQCVDYVRQRLELGRRELAPEWKVEWNCDTRPKPILYIRKSALVAYAEICASEDYFNSHWPRIVSAAITAGVAAGIATIIATPTAAVPIFRAEFHKQLQGKGSDETDDEIQVALSARREANGPWYLCKE